MLPRARREAGFRWPRSQESWTQQYRCVIFVSSNSTPGWLKAARCSFRESPGPSQRCSENETQPDDECLVDSSYEDRVRSSIDEILDGGCSSLTELCRRAGGAFPIDILRIGGPRLERLPVNGPDFGADHGLDSAPPGAPEPHPIDFEWRFTADDADALAAEIASGSGRIACLGTPGVFWRLIRRGADVVLYDRNPRIRRCIEAALAGSARHVETVDLNATCPVSTGHAIVVMDPPWYIEQYEMWVAHAGRLVDPGGFVVTSLFPPLLRPQACGQRRLVKELLSDLGTIERSRPVLYATPRFEQEVLDTARLGRLGNWRVAEMLWIRVGSTSVNRRSPVRKSDLQWLRFQLGARIIAVRSDPADCGTVRLRPVGQDSGFRLRSVSSRAPERSAINVWTSRNRAANATGIPRVIEFLRSLEIGGDPDMLVDQAADDDKDGLRTLMALIAA